MTRRTTLGESTKRAARVVFSSTAGCALSAALATFSFPATAQENDDCLACHSADEPAAGDTFDLSLHGFEDSMHALFGLSCVDCHVDLADEDPFDHPMEPAPADCSACHADQVAAASGGVHAGGEFAGGESCTTCHGAHAILPASDTASPTYKFAIPETCGRCHAASRAGSGPVNDAPKTFASFEDGIHGRALSKSGLNVAPDCTTCHGVHGIRPPSDEASPAHRASVPSLCGQCHAGITPAYADSVHGEMLVGGHPLAPTCIDCHSAHAIDRAAMPQWRLDVVAECGTCHEELVERYRDTFHGKVTALGFERVASCSDCHGAHEIKRSSDPASRVSSENLVATCGECHERMNASFALYDPHPDPSDRERSPALYFANWIMKGLLVFVFSFFLLHTALWLPRSLIEARAIRRARRAAVGARGLGRGQTVPSGRKSLPRAAEKRDDEKEAP